MLFHGRQLAATNKVCENAKAPQFIFNTSLASLCIMYAMEEYGRDTTPCLFLSRTTSAIICKNLKEEMIFHETSSWIPMYIPIHAETNIRAPCRIQINLRDLVRNMSSSDEELNIVAMEMDVRTVHRGMLIQYGAIKDNDDATSTDDTAVCIIPILNNIKRATQTWRSENADAFIVSGHDMFRSVPSLVACTHFRSNNRYMISFVDLARSVPPTKLCGIPIDCISRTTLDILVYDDENMENHPEFHLYLYMLATPRFHD